MNEKDRKFFEEACNDKAATVIKLLYKMLNTNKDKALTYMALHKLQLEILQAMELIKDDMDLDGFFNEDNKNAG